MANEKGTPAGSASVWGQVITAVVLVGGLAVGLWSFTNTSSSDSAAASRGATCSREESAKASGTPARGAAIVTAAQLCHALNRPDLADLLGTPGEVAKSTSSSGSGLTLAGGKNIPNPSAQVELGTYTVNLQASYDHLKVGQFAKLLGDTVRPQTVLGRPAYFSSDRTFSVRFRLDGSDSRSGQGVMARSLQVALDPKDGGGCYEVSLWRSDGGVPDDAVLLRVAEEVLPTVPGWASGG
jgi:hypothetical protein